MSGSFSGANLSGASLRNTDAREVSFSRAILRGVDFRGADVRGADLRWSDLRAADLRGAMLDTAVLHEARYDATTRWPEGFDPDVAGCIDTGDGGSRARPARREARQEPASTPRWKAFLKEVLIALTRASPAFTGARDRPAEAPAAPPPDDTPAAARDSSPEAADQERVVRVDENGSWSGR